MYFPVILRPGRYGLRNGTRYHLLMNNGTVVHIATKKSEVIVRCEDGRCEDLFPKSRDTFRR